MSQASSSIATSAARARSTDALISVAKRCGLLTLKSWFAVALLSVHVAVAAQVTQSADRYPMHIQRIAIQEGLSQNTVLDVLQDSQGFIWLATENGLNRFDGYTVTRYLRGTTSGLPDDFVYSIAEDHNGNIWVGTARGGIARWIREEDRFEAIDTDQEHSPADGVRKLLVTSRRDLWVGTLGSGISVRALDGDQVRHFASEAGRQDSLPSDHINALYQDRGGLIWVGTNQGLARFDDSTNSFVRFGTNGGNRGTVGSNIRAIYEDSKGVLWIGTESGGLNAYYRSNGQFVHYAETAPLNAPRASLTAASGADYCGGAVRAITEDLSQRLWSATNQGLCLFDRSNKTFANYGKSTELSGLGDNDLMSLLLDRSGQLWVGTRSDGVNLWNPQSWQLGHSFASLPLGSVSSFASDQKGFWVGSTSNGLLRVDHLNAEPKFLTKTDGLTDNSVMSLASAADGGLWVGTMTGGLMKLNAQGTVTDAWRADASGTRGGLPNDGVMSLLKDSRGRLWTGLYGGGVARKDLGSSTFTPMQNTEQHPTRLLGNQGLALVEDLAGTIWVGTELGLNRYNEESKIFEAFTHDPTERNSLSAESVYSLHVDATGQLWTGTAGGGLDKVIVTEAGVRFEHQDTLLDLGMNLIYGIHSDLNNNLWLSSNRGLVRYSPEHRKAKRFREAHGLQGDEFNFGAHHAGVDGHLYFGGTAGFNRFNPADLSVPTRSPAVAITRIQLSGKDLSNQFSASVKSLHVGYENDVVAFEFAALDYVDTASNKFEYRLRGHNDVWIDAGSSRRISYSNVSPGTYTLQVRGANSAGVWSEHPAALDVTFEPPPWRSMPAYGLYALVLLGLLWLAYRIWHARRVREITHRNELHRLAYFDALTALPNRHQLEETGDALISTQTNKILAVIHVNLDHFKRLNDSLGHATADRLLVEFSHRLRAHTEGLCGATKAPLLARIGGDEFAAVIPDLTTHADATVFAARLQAALSETLRVDLAEALVTVSVGMALYPNDGDSMAQLLKHSDIAMRGAKQTGRNTFRSFEPAMIATTEADLQLEAELHAATETDQLELYYQPKVTAHDLRICGSEALIRWNHPERGMVSPGVFIPMAERTGLISRVDRWVLQRAFEQQQAWQIAKFPRSVTSLNVSAGQFARSEFLDYLHELNTRYSIDPQTLEIEITEGVLMQDARAARKTLAKIKDLGFRVAIDDFGTGYSSLSYLKNFAVDVLKIDRSFVMDLETDNSNRSICRAVLGLASSLGLEAVAEGVETQAQYEFLRDEGCDQIQGYWIARPEPVETFEAFVLERASSGVLVPAPASR